MNTSQLAEELARLQEQIGQVRRKREKLEAELRAVDGELERLSADRQRFDALQNVCSALDRLKELKAEELFWDGTAESRQQASAQIDRARGRAVRFQGEIKGILDKQSALRTEINACVDELYALDYAVEDAYSREARREEEYVIERDISPVPDRGTVMPWSRDAESERRFRKALLIALLAALCFGTAIPLLELPAPVRPPVAVVPERLVSMLRQERPKPEHPKEEKKPEKEQDEKAQKEERPKPATPEVQAARKKAESTGVLAFKESLKDLIAEEPASRLGAQARLSSTPAAGQGRASRSIVALPASAGGSSGGISNSGISRTIGHESGKRIGTVGFTRVESKVAELKEEAAKPVSSGAGPGAARTDEEIQIVFDKYKATLYRMYNAELRRNPSLRGKIILRITIEPGGEVSACTVQSNDLKSPELVDQIVARVKKFNFGEKEKAAKTTILYPIDFLPGG